MSDWGKRLHKRKIVWGVAGAFMTLAPVALWAYYYGPNPGSTGAPNDVYKDKACAASGCHI